MKFKIQRSRILDGLKSVQNIVSGKGSLAVLQNVMIETIEKGLVLTTTDLDISIRSEIDCEVIEPGKTTLPVKYLFTSISRAAEGDIEIETDGQEKATIKAGSARFRLQGLPASDFPQLPTEKDAYMYSLPQVTFREMLRKTAYAASQDDTRRTLKGVSMSFKDAKLTMVATDGRRLALVENEIEFPKSEERDLVLPSKAVCELQRSLTGEESVSIMVQQTQISFKFGNVMIFSKLMDDVYPNYTQVIPKNCVEHIKIDRQLLLDALERASVMTLDESHSTRLIFEANKLTVTSAVSDIGDAKDEVPIKYLGEKIEIMFNPNYVIDPLKAIDNDEVEFELNDGHSPAVIREGGYFLYVLMPLRINS